MSDRGPETPSGEAPAQQNLSEEEATRRIRRSDEECAEWIRSLHRTNDHWDPARHDIVAQADQLPSAKVTDLIIENLTRSAAQPTESSVSAVDDFLLAANIEMLLFGSGHDVQVTAESGAVESILVVAGHGAKADRDCSAKRLGKVRMQR